MNPVDRALETMRKAPSSLPKEPHSYRLTDPATFCRLARSRIRLAEKCNRPIAEIVCHGCGRIVRRMHAGRVNCDTCIRVRKLLNAKKS